MLKEFEGVDFIIHAGDFCSSKDLELLAKIKEVKAVHGNMDGSDIIKYCPRRQIIKVNGFKIGLFHGEGPPQTLMQKIEEEFKGEKLDVIIYGHSHLAMNEKRGNVLYFNPGSPTDTVFAPYRSYGILDVTDKGISGSIIKVKD